MIYGVLRRKFYQITLFQKVNLDNYYQKNYTKFYLPSFSGHLKINKFLVMISKVETFFII